MNFYLLDNDKQNLLILRNIVENDFDNTLIGDTTDPNQAYEDLLQFRVDIMFLPALLPGTTGVDLIHRLRKANCHPRFIMTGFQPSSPIKSAAYQAGCDFFLPTPFNRDETKKVIHLVSNQVKMATNLNTIYELSSTIFYNRPQKIQRQQMDHVDEILRFLGIAAETGSEDIRKIIRLMVNQRINFATVNLNCDLQLNEHEKKITYQRIRRTLRVGIINLAAMCSDYPENEILLEYANNLFEYQNVHIEIQRLHNSKIRHGQISIQHFFNGLLQEAFRASKYT